ncbi:MAG TPA: TonB-dependent receptor [Saprospiraceae bacterium]|nr:TonB-dependent receptor [Saprospiraceae bacterium]HMQ82101.1 TonB-dependent receptor [Saprospiraceae bacterium]
MKNCFLLLFSLLLTSTLVAQFPGGRQGQNNAPSSDVFSRSTKGIGKITGFVLDSLSGTGVEFANIALYDMKNEQLIDGSVADEKGKFSIEGLVDGNYRIVVSFLGYSNKTVGDIKIVREKSVNIGAVLLSEGAQVLEAVTVTSTKALIEEKVDRLVYNAEKDELAKGGDAADVLRKVPLLQVDLEGNVSVRGSSNIKVLINNKPSTIVASSIADALKMIPADMIKSVEVITSPSARYDAEGSAGIINIITKKDRLEGYSLNVDAGAGLRGSNLGLNGSYRQGKFGLNLGGHGRISYNDAETDMEQRTITDGNTNLTRQSAEASDNGIFGHYSLGMDYDIDKTQALSGNVRYGIRDFSREQLQTTDLFLNDVLQNTALRDIENTNASNNVDVNLDYIRTLRAQQEWSISTQYSRNDLVNDFVSDNLDENKALINSLENLNDNLNEEITLQTDYQTPILDNQLLEIGAKGIFRSVNSNYSYFFAEADGDYSLDLTRPAGALDYEQDVTAAYTSYTYSTPNKYTFKLGVRWENTTIDAVQEGQPIEIPDYNNIVPSLNLSKRLNNGNTLKLGYNRRIQRPGLQQLNPNVNVSNNQDVQVGNPNLRPELTDNIELSISTLLEKTYINTSFFGRITDNAINQVRTPIDSILGAILTTYENIGRERSIGSNIFANVYLTNNWTINGGVDVYYSMLEGQVTGENGQSVTVSNSGFNYGGRLMSQLQFKSGWGFQAFSFMRGRRIDLQGMRGGWGMYSLGARKNFNNKKGSLGISAENFLNRGWNIKSEIESPGLSQVSNNLMLNRNIKINLSYKFGKLNFTESRRKTKSVRNDDVLSGGDGGMGGGTDVGGNSSTGSQNRGAFRQNQNANKGNDKDAPKEKSRSKKKEKVQDEE